MHAWIMIHQVPLSMEFSRQEYWSGLPFPTEGFNPHFLHWQMDSLPLGKPGKPREYLRLDIWIFALVTVMMDTRTVYICQNPQNWTTGQRVISNINYGLSNFSIWFINCNKYSTLMRDVNNKGSCVSMKRRGGNYTLSSLFVNLKPIQ